MYSTTRTNTKSGPAPMWTQEAPDEVSQLRKAYPGLEQELYLESGQTYALDALPRLLWVRNKMPDVYEKIAYVGMFNDWLIHKMTRILAVEPSNGSTTGLFSLKNGSWDSSIARRCGLRTDMFPEVTGMRLQSRNRDRTVRGTDRTGPGNACDCRRRRRAAGLYRA